MFDVMFDIQPGDRLLDLDAGDGRPAHELAAQVPYGVLVGLVADRESLSQARAHCRDLDNVFFIEATPAEIPWKEDYFSHAIARRVLQPAELREVHRVLAEGGRAFIAAGAAASLEAAGFADVETRQGWVTGRKTRPTTPAG
jgi:ubiquinone/menaquinone biosynthesis C-methylase UbiE